MPTVAIVMPVYREELGEDDCLALQACEKYLSGHDVILMCPRGMSVDIYMDYLPKAMMLEFPTKHFRSLRTYSQLVKSEEFYSQFSRYEYILIYQLDCLVFKDDLLEWCGKGYSYIGAPWFELSFIGDRLRPFFQWNPLNKWMFPKVGNGGLSLRKVDQHIELSRKYKWLAKLTPYINEDLFWCGIVGRLEHRYAIPDVETALGFAIETNPTEFFEKIGRVPPFGCHAWKKHDIDFWEEYV